MQPLVDLDPPRADASRDRLVLFWSIVGLCALFGYYLIYIFRRIDHGHFGDFPTFYDAGRAVRRGSDPYIPEPGGMAYVYPPMFAVLCTALTRLTLAHAAKVFVAINLTSAVLTLLLGSRQMLRRFDGPSTAAGICVVALVAGLLAENDLRGELQQMETDVLMMLMFALSLYWLDRHPLRSGAALAFAFNIKYLSLLALPYLILRRRWKAAGAMIGWTVCFGLLPALALGWNENLRCLRGAIGGLLGWTNKTALAARGIHVHAITDGLSISVTSAIARVLKAHALSPSFALVIAAGLGVILLLFAGLLYRKNRLPFLLWPAASKQESQPFRALVGIEWMALVVVALAFSPNTNTRHLSMVALIYTAAATLLLVQRAGVHRGPVLAGTIILFIGLILPPPGMFPHAFVAWYFRYSLCGCELLVMYALTLITALRYIRTGAKLE